MPWKLQPIRIQKRKHFILDGITPNFSIMPCACVALIVLVTVFYTWYKIIMQRFLFVYLAISPLAFVGQPTRLVEPSVCQECSKNKKALKITRTFTIFVQHGVMIPIPWRLYKLIAISNGISHLSIVFSWCTFSPKGSCVYQENKSNYWDIPWRANSVIVFDWIGEVDP